MGRKSALWGRKAPTSRSADVARSTRSRYDDDARRGASLPGATPGQVLGRQRGSTDAALYLDACDSHGVHMACALFGAARRYIVNDVLKPQQRRETHRHRKKSRWMRPETLRLAFAALRVAVQVAKLIDFFFRR